MTGGAGQIVYFVRDGVASDCGAPVKPFQELQTTAFVEQNAGKIKYDQWGDNHDGYHLASAFNLTAVVADTYFTFEIVNFPATTSKKTTLPFAALDVVVPNTTFNFQLWGNFSGHLPEFMPYALPEWESCRNQTLSWVPQHSSDLFWWKSTFATANPEREAAFAVTHLGGREVPSPFPVPDEPGCTRAHWVAFDATGWMLHFVYSPEFAPRNASLAIAAWEAKIRGHRNLKHGALDTWMWNRVVFWSDAGLDAFIRNLDAAHVAYTTRDWPAEKNGRVTRSLLVASTGGLAYEIRAHVKAPPAALWDVCHPSSVSVTEVLARPAWAAASVPNLHCTVGDEELAVEYRTQYYKGRVDCGNLIMKMDLTTLPRVQYAAAKEGKTYTLLLFATENDATMSWPDEPVPGKVRFHWAAVNLSAATLLSGDLSQASHLFAYQPPHHGPSPTQPYSFYLMEHDGPTPVPTSKTAPCPLDDSNDPKNRCTHSDFDAWLTSYSWRLVGNNYFVGLFHNDTFRRDAPGAAAAVHTVATRPTAAVRAVARDDRNVGLLVAMSNVSSAVAICTPGAAECVLDVHFVHWVVPGNSTSTGISTMADATYTFADGTHSSSAPMHTRLEYVLHDTTTERYELPEGSPLPVGRIAHQWLARLSARVPRATLPTAVCVAITASDAMSGETGVKLMDGDGQACLKVSIATVATPQRESLAAFINHPAMTYTCPTDAAAPCLAFGHLVLSVYPRDPTHQIFGGGAVARRAADGVSLATPLSSRGVRFEYQAKPTTGRGVFSGMLGPRALLGLQQLVYDRSQLTRDMCFIAWAADGATNEVVTVRGYDTNNPHGPPYPHPSSDGVFCFRPVEKTPLISLPLGSGGP